MDDPKPSRFTDYSQNYLTSTMSTTSGLGSIYTTNTPSGLSSSSMSGSTQPTPSPRRKHSASSFNNEYCPEIQEDVPVDAENRLAGYHHNMSSVPIQSYPMERSAYFGSAVNPYQGFEKESFFNKGYRFDGGSTEHTNYEVVRSVPQMGISAGHRRTMSNVSSSCSLNPSSLHYGTSDEMMYQQLKNLNFNSTNPFLNSSSSPPTSLPPIMPSAREERHYENVPFNSRSYADFYGSKGSGIGYGSSYNQLAQYPQYNVDPPSTRPTTLLNFEPGTKLRSSLKKSSNQSNQASCSGTPTNTNEDFQTGIQIGLQPGGTTEGRTHNTSDESGSYLSAKEEGSVSSQSRVRFSPDVMQDFPHKVKVSGDEAQRPIRRGTPPS